MLYYQAYDIKCRKISKGANVYFFQTVVGKSGMNSFEKTLGRMTEEGIVFVFSPIFPIFPILVFPSFVLNCNENPCLAFFNCFGVLFVPLYLYQNFIALLCN